MISYFLLVSKIVVDVIHDDRSASRCAEQVIAYFILFDARKLFCGL